MGGRSRSPARQAPLRALRVAVSTTVLLILVAGSVPVLAPIERVAASVARAQLLPSLLRLRQVAVIGVGSALFVFPALLLITFAVGRGYCSSLCPLGTLQDGALALSRKLSRTKLRFRSPHGVLRAAVLALVVIAWGAGSALPLALLEPYSIVSRVLAVAFGSFAATAGRPAQPGDASSLASTAATPVAAAVLSTLVLLSVLVAAAARGRLFCNTLCPAGALLSLPGRYSLLRVRMASGRCTGCGLCERVCPARCIDVRSRRIYTGSCTLCFSCLDACPSGALRYGRRSGAS